METVDELLREVSEIADKRNLEVIDQILKKMSEYESMRHRGVSKRVFGRFDGCAHQRTKRFYMEVKKEWYDIRRMLRNDRFPYDFPKTAQAVIELEKAKEFLKHQWLCLRKEYRWHTPCRVCAMCLIPSIRLWNSVDAYRYRNSDPYAKREYASGQPPRDARLCVLYGNQPE